MKSEKKLLHNIRFWTVLYILALIFWGVTAFPIQTELKIVCQLLGISLDASPETYTGLYQWLATVYQGLDATNTSYPFLAYGTDWLAFSHIVIAIAFVGVYVKPVTNQWIIYWAMIACIGVIPLALICGYIRGIPFFWRLIDCSFSFFGIIPLLILHTYIRELQALTRVPHYKY